MRVVSCKFKPVQFLSFRPLLYYSLRNICRRGRVVRWDWTTFVQVVCLVLRSTFQWCKGAEGSLASRPGNPLEYCQSSRRTPFFSFLWLMWCFCLCGRAPLDYVKLSVQHKLLLGDPPFGRILSPICLRHWNCRWHFKTPYSFSPKSWAP